MPMIGKAGFENKSKFADITMKKAEIVDGQPVDAKIGDELNKISGVKPEARFVDRKTHETLGPDGFMKLLAHQLKNQDPMKPMDQKDFSSNLAQFSQLEQLTSMNKKFDRLSENNNNEKRFQGASFLGKKVVTAGTTIDYQGDGKDADLPFYMEKAAKNVIVHIYDSKNQMIGKIEREDIGKGQNTIKWDGVGLDGQIAPKESYHFDVVAFDKDNQKFLGQTRAEGTVTGVRFENGETILDVTGGKKVFLKDVESFALPEKEAAAATTNSDESKKVPALQKQATNAYNQIENQINN
jgi:flagellar basal-body rod modification protein FlgD